jgi:ABC-type transport system substrate-binding protein
VVGAQDEVVLVIGIEQEHARQRPLNTMSWSGYIESIYGRDLWEWNLERVAEPVMAEAIPSMEDGTIGLTEEGNTWIEVTLREGLFWSDGVPITSADCEAWHNVRFNPETSPNVGRGLYPDIVESFEIVDDLTFRITYNQPFPDVVAADERPQCLYPAHILNPPLEAGGVIDDSPYWDMTDNESVAFGPFKVVARERGASWTLVQNEYWPEDFTQPAVDRIVLVDRG